MAFRSEINIEKNKHFNNIISIGDAEYEYYALINLFSNYNNTHNFKLLKSIKFIRYPNFVQLYKQINLLCDCIIKICTINTPVDLELSSIDP